MRYEKPIHYNGNSNVLFQRELKDRVQDYFQKQKSSPFANFQMWMKVIFFLSSYFVLWSLLVFKPHNLLTTLVLIIAFSFITMFVAFNVAHEAVHTTLTGKSKFDHWIFYFVFNLLGPNAYLWKIRHNNAHHFFVNIPGSDMDIEGTQWLRVAPHVPWKPIHRFQNYFCGFFYSIFTLHWIIFKDFKIIRMKSFGCVTDLNHSPWRYLELVAWKLIYFCLMIGIPVYFLPYSFYEVLLGFIGFHLFFSFILMVTFAMSHIAMESHYVVPIKDGNLSHNFYEHQLLTSVDYCSQNPWANFFLGGFNNHVAHHMFPNICSIHYGPINLIIRELAKKYSLPYHEKSLWELVRSHFKIMEALGNNRGEEFIVS